MDNVKLYEQDNVVSKYTAKTSRLRQLNNIEKQWVDYYQVADKNVLVLGGGAGRIPSNLMLFGNKVTSVDLSQNLHQAALKDYPPEKFPNLNFVYGDASKIDFMEDESFDVTCFPMGIDLLNPIETRERCLKHLARTVVKNGVVAFGSHNLNAYGLSYKFAKNHKNIKYLKAKNYIYEEEKVIGGGTLFKGTPEFIIKHTEEITGLKFDKMFVDCKNRFEIKLSQTKLAKYIFPYIMYAFIKK